MRTRKLSSYEASLITKYNLQPQAYKGNTKIFSREEINQAWNAEIDKREAAEKAVEQARLKADSEYFTSPEFRQDVIDELMAKGATWEQACNRTRDQVRLFAEASELGLM